MVRYTDVSVTKVTSKFLSIVHIQGTPDAKTIFEAVNQHAIELGLPIVLEKWNSLAYLSSTVLSTRKFWE